MGGGGTTTAPRTTEDVEDGRDPSNPSTCTAAVKVGAVGAAKFPGVAPANEGPAGVGGGHASSLRREKNEK